MILRLLVAFCLCAGSLSAAIWPNPSRLGIMVERSANDDSRSSRYFANSLADAFARYTDFYLTTGGFTVVQVGSVSDSTCDMRLTFSLTGDLKNRTMLRVDRRRRHRFVTVRNLLDLRTHYVLAERRNNAWVEIAHGNITERADPRWIDRFGVPTPPSIDSFFATQAEPIEYVLQRAVERCINQLHFRTRDFRPADTAGTHTLVTLLADPSYPADHGVAWQRDINATAAVASRFYAENFNFSLQTDRVTTNRFVPDYRLPIRELYDIMVAQKADPTTQLTLAVYSYRNPLDHVLGRDHDEIGLSRTGGNLILVRDFPVPKDVDSRWSALFSGLNFAHELGHKYGAVHVSDSRSLMNHSLSWLVPAGVDRLNTVIIRAALDGRLNPADSISYINFVAQSIDSTGYDLADFPPIFHRLLPVIEGSPNPKSPFARIKPFYFMAAQAYGHLVHGELSAAADLFRKAIALAPDQAALHFYLANCTAGEESQTAWQTAANLGYWQAQIAAGQARRH